MPPPSLPVGLILTLIPSCSVCLSAPARTPSVHVFFPLSQAQVLQTRATTRGDAKDYKNAKDKLKRCGERGAGVVRGWFCLL